MPEIKEEVLVDIQLEQDEGAFKKLADLKNVLLNNKQEQLALTEAFKKGQITQKEYASEVVRLETSHKKLSAQFSETQRSVTGLKNPLTELNKSIKEQPKIVQAAGQAFAPIAGMIAGAFSIGAITNFVKGVFNVTAEFQKFAAVLTNTLGSSSRAQEALGMIQQFAAETPFSVQELTDSFVKLANQGFVPTKNEMRQLGDLASSTGKSFDQLTEGILDAQTGQFERLKEFGIKAKKEGDNVTFTFKGVEKQVAFTSDAMKDYILSLGDTIGVSGSMAAISQTLGGQVSNLGDSWDNLLKTLGEGNSGVFAGVISFLNDAVSNVTALLETSEQKEKRLSIQRRVNIKEDFKAFAEAFKDREKAYSLEFERIDEAIEKDKLAGGSKLETLEIERTALTELHDQEAIDKEKQEEQEAKLEEKRKERALAEQIRNAEKLKRTQAEVDKKDEQVKKEAEGIDKRLVNEAILEQKLDDARTKKETKDEAARQKAIMGDMLVGNNKLLLAKQEQDIAEKIAAQNEADLLKKVEGWSKYVSLVQGFLGSIFNAIQVHYKLQENELAVTLANQKTANQTAYNEEIKGIEDKFKKGEISKEDYDKAVLGANQRFQAANKQAEIDQAVALNEIKKKEFEANKKQSIIDAGISAAKAILQSFVQLGWPLGLIPAAAMGVLAGIQIKQIKDTEFVPTTFYEGGFGYTGDGDPRSVSTALGHKNFTYHKQEYITPWKVLSTPEGSYHVGQLEAMRTGKKSFAGGGMAGGVTMDDFNALVNRINTMQTVLVMEDFEVTNQRRVEVAEKATLSS